MVAGKANIGSNEGVEPGMKRSFRACSGREGIVQSLETAQRECVQKRLLVSEVPGWGAMADSDLPRELSQ